ncbi:uncharacterized protein [Physcomitrium patens]|uniref:PH domain-containing protein n=1 Tax=Physcomitrium patens TaxID=3218 RepID=A0A2K1KBN2_PHYPA|nr:uncharacterized protein LOC112284616 isoform X2 [Physcomitrium patens]PNR51187.1 hypothetical protein PHYPA_010373 [Physcomitrium patens]|eukprot:XP_024380359.1 uncharacterized protein LOC112284616 isoform X2 [Physcomitrella patens]
MEAVIPHQQRQRRRRSSASKELAHGHRKIYDPRRWHKRTNSGSDTGGRPPAGWVLIWAGRFKRWRRRWFVANPPGLLLHYKNSDQIGRHGCISLLGATVVPALGKERQFKIIKGSMVYYLRTISRDYRQPWLDAINESIRVYHYSVQRAAGVGDFGTALPSHSSMSSHMREGWEVQEREFKRRVKESLRNLEPTQQAFLEQLQMLQQSLSTISGVLGFAERLELPSKSTTTNGPILSSLPEASWRSNELFMTGNDVFELGYDQQQTAFPTAGIDRISSPEMGVMNLVQNKSGPMSPQMFRFQENDSESRGGSCSLLMRKIDVDAFLPDESTQDSIVIRPQKSVHTVTFPGEHKFKRDRRNSSMSLDEDDFDSSTLDISCIRAECFPGRKRSGHGNASDTESGSKKKSIKFNSPLHPWKRNGDSTSVITPTSSQELDSSLTKKIEKDLFVQNKEINGSSYGATCTVGEASNHGSKEGLSGTGQSKAMDGEGSTRPARNGLFSQGPLHVAWNNMQDTYSEALKEEIFRVLELEAENAVLQHALRTLPQLQQDRAALLSMRERYKKERLCECGRKIAYEDSVLEDGDDTEEDIAIVHPDVGNEEYFEALEVLNHHEFVARSTSTEEHENLLKASKQEPSEEAEIGDADFLSEAEGEEIDQPRRRLPAPRPLSRGFTMWTILKNAVGRDLNNITMPATINEPLSVLQKCAEELQYRDLLEQAVRKTDSLERLLLATAFTCASYYGSIHRDAKPFNPLLGETYEYQGKNSWFLAEQVSHHPPILAFQSENVGGAYQLFGEIELKNKFWGKSIEVLCNGGVHLKIPQYGDHITWNRATLCIHNVVVGKCWIDNYGEVSVVNHKTSEVGRVRFHKATSREQCRITGKMYDAKGIPQYKIFGNYMEAIYACPESCMNFDVNAPDVRLLWKAPEQIEDFRQQYCFTQYTLGLNELTPKLLNALPPTDSRFRPDQRALEDGNLEKATPEKLRLEEKQRSARRVRKEKGIEWQNMWFTQRDPGVSEVKSIEIENSEPSWVYKGTYWDAHDQRAWENCPDIM